MQTVNRRTDESRFSREQVLDVVRQVVGEQVGIASQQIREQDRLINDLGCDSLDVVEINMEVEEHFDITSPDDVDVQAITVGEIVDGVLQLLGETPSDPQSLIPNP